VVIFVSIIVFSAIGGGSLLWRIGSRVLLLPLVIGISYEFIKVRQTPIHGKILHNAGPFAAVYDNKGAKDRSDRGGDSRAGSALDPKGVTEPLTDKAVEEAAEQQ
jgi:hypothetical protein